MDSVNTCENLKETILSQVGETTVMDTDEFQMGFFRKSEKLWINNDRDVSDALDLMRVGKLTLWCMGKSKQPKHGKRNRDKSGDAEDEAEFTSGRSKKKKSSSEERVARVNEIKAQLRDQHGSLYSGVQYTMWAEMIVAGSHESLDDPPQCPPFGAKRSCGQSNNLAVTLSDLAGKLVNAVSPQTSTNPNPNSPTKLVDLRGKYLQQLKEMVHLRDIGALTPAEYEEHRAVINLMRKLSSN